MLSWSLVRLILLFYQGRNRRGTTRSQNKNRRQRNALTESEEAESASGEEDSAERKLGLRAINQNKL